MVLTQNKMHSRSVRNPLWTYFIPFVINKFLGQCAFSYRVNFLHQVRKITVVLAKAKSFFFFFIAYRVVTGEANLSSGTPFHCAVHQHFKYIYISNTKCCYLLQPGGNVSLVFCLLTLICLVPTTYQNNFVD